MSEKVRLTCPMGRKRAESWSGSVLVPVGACTAAAGLSGLFDLPVLPEGPLAWSAAALGAAALLAGIVLLVDGIRLRVPVLEVEDGEFRYTRGRYIVRIPSADVGSYYVLPGAPALWDCATSPAGRATSRRCGGAAPTARICR